MMRHAMSSFPRAERQRDSSGTLDLASGFPLSAALGGNDNGGGWAMRHPTSSFPRAERQRESSGALDLASGFRLCAALGGNDKAAGWAEGGGMRQSCGQQLCLPLEGGGRDATDLARHRRVFSIFDRRAKYDGVAGGGEACDLRRPPVTPTRCVPWLSPVVACVADVGDAGLNHGRIALPPPGGGTKKVSDIPLTRKSGMTNGRRGAA